VDECIVPGGHDMADTKYKLVGTNVGRAVGDNFLLDNCDFLRRLLIYCSKRHQLGTLLKA